MDEMSGTHLEEPAHSARGKTRHLLRPIHRVCLPRSRLAVREDAHVETVKNGCHQRLRLAEDVLLRLMTDDLLINT